MATEGLSPPHTIPRPTLVATFGSTTTAGSWRQPWWKPAIGIPLYVLAAALVLGGLLAGLLTAAVQGLELLLVALIAADAWRIRQRLPLLRSHNKRIALAGWVGLVAILVSVSLLLPAF